MKAQKKWETQAHLARVAFETHVLLSSSQTWPSATEWHNQKGGRCLKSYVHQLSEARGSAPVSCFFRVGVVKLAGRGLQPSGSCERLLSEGLEAGIKSETKNLV